MKRLLPVVLLLNFFQHHVNAQKQGQERIDSLTQELQKNMADTQKVLLLCDICQTYYAVKPDEGIKYCNRALELAGKINFEKGIYRSYYLRGNNYLGLVKLPEATSDYTTALKYYEKIKDEKWVAGIYSNLGGVYSYQGKNEKALEYFQKALEINMRISPAGRYIVANHSNMALIYHSTKQYDKALEHALKGWKICEENNLSETLPIATSILGSVYLKLNDNKRAVIFTRKALELAKQNGDNSTEGQAYVNLGESVLQILVDNDKASLDTFYNGNRQTALNDVRKNLNNAITLISANGNALQLTESFRFISEMEEYAGNYKQSLYYHKKFQTLNDSLRSDENNEKILQTGLEYEFDKKTALTKSEQEKKDVLTNAEIRKQKIMRNSITAGLAGVVLFSLVVYRQRNRISKEKMRSEELLLNILPSEVAEELKEKGSADAKQFEEVTVLFTDFKNFTSVSEKLSPQELVNEINACYSAFDNIITRYGIEKIKTIGDSYMCAGGLPVPNKTNAEDIVHAAIEIRNFMLTEKQKREADGKTFFEIRIGCHTGSVVAGIVGIKKFAYDIWGDTVNIASRMESSGEAGKVNISGTTHQLVKDKFNCEHRGKIHAKNKGEIDMYFVES